MAELKKIWDKYTQGWAGSIIYIILGFIIALLFNAGLGFALNTDTPVVAVFSDSMVPTYFKGDMIIVMNYSNYEDVKIGDVIVFSVPDRRYPIIHRIYNITNGVIITKGDHNQYVDPWTTTRNNIHGKAILKIPLLGWVKIIFNEITGL
ncbi:MAG: signal peptidase I [Candidatus Aenigmatarchaeota archaeon]